MENVSLKRRKCILGIFHCYMEYAALKDTPGANVTLQDLGFQTDFTVYLQIRQTWLAFSKFNMKCAMHPSPLLQCWFVTLHKLLPAGAFYLQKTAVGTGRALDDLPADSALYYVTRLPSQLAFTISKGTSESAAGVLQSCRFSPPLFFFFLFSDHSRHSGSDHHPSPHLPQEKDFNCHCAHQRSQQVRDAFLNLSSSSS